MIYMIDVNLIINNSLYIAEFAYFHNGYFLKIGNRSSLHGDMSLLSLSKIINFIDEKNVPIAQILEIKFLLKDNCYFEMYFEQYKKRFYFLYFKAKELINAAEYLDSFEISILMDFVRKVDSFEK